MTQKETLDHIHQTLTPVLRDTVRVLDENHLPYSAICGTLLGAVRHQGFIPWDDDVDLVLPRSSYEAFKKLYPVKADENFMLDLSDTWVPRTRDKRAPEAFIDLFILDPLPAGKLARAWKLLRLRTLQGMLKENVDYSRFSFAKRLALRLTHILGLPFSKQRKLHVYERIAKSTSAKSPYLHMSNGAFDLLSLSYPKSVFEEMIALPFEGMMISAPKDYDRVLKLLFGDDYMTPPPESERYAKHIKEA